MWDDDTFGNFAGMLMWYANVPGISVLRLNKLREIARTQWQTADGRAFVDYTLALRREVMKYPNNRLKSEQVWNQGRAYNEARSRRHVRGFR
jgi:hypothetical protein